jgi:hypothetical protein
MSSKLHGGLRRWVGTASFVPGAQLLGGRALHEALPLLAQPYAAASTLIVKFRKARGNFPTSLRILSHTPHPARQHPTGI